MTEGTEVLHAKISATDDAGATIEGIRKKVEGLGKEFHHAGEASKHVHQPHVWSELGEHVEHVQHHFGHLHESIGEVGSSITELLPSFAAFGAAASVAGLFETVERVSEAYAEMGHQAAALGISAEQMHELNIMARLTDTNVEGLSKSMTKLNRTLAESAAGKNKDAAALFAHLGISLKDASGHIRDSNDVLPELAEAFRNTHDIALETRMAFTLFGKSGADMIPMLEKGKDALREIQGESRRLGVDMSPYTKGLHDYDESMKALKLSTSGFTDELGGKLAPVLRPLVKDAERWVLANRDWISTDIADRIDHFGKSLEKLDLKGITANAKALAAGVEHVIDFFGGWNVAIDVVAASMEAKIGITIYEPLAKVVELSKAIGVLTFKLGVELGGAWAKVGAAASAAGAEELAASAAGASFAAGGAKTVAGHALRAIPVIGTAIAVGAGINEGMKALGYHGIEEAHSSYAGRGGIIGLHPGARPFLPNTESLADAPALPPGPSSITHDVSVTQSGKVEVAVRLYGAPPGTTASAISTGGNLSIPKINVGPAMGPH